MQLQQDPSIGAQFNCSDVKEVSTLLDKLETYVILSDVTTAGDNPFRKLSSFNVNNIAKQTSDYWNCRVLDSCTNPSALSNGVAAAHVIESREYSDSHIRSCCVQSTFDPHPQC